MCDNRSSTKYNVFKVIFIADSALSTRQPCTISLSLNAASAAVSFGQICLTLLSSPSSTALAKPSLLLKMTTSTTYMAIYIVLLSLLFTTLLCDPGKLSCYTHGACYVLLLVVCTVSYSVRWFPFFIHTLCDV